MTAINMQNNDKHLFIIIAMIGHWSLLAVSLNVKFSLKVLSNEN